MTDSGWTGGYVLDVEYVHNFLPGLAPLNLALATLLGGVRPPDADGAFAYLDLGCGNGFTPALIAAANPQARIWGSDFNPAHIRNARATAQAAGLDNATFVEASFANFPAVAPLFDFVVIHGIWSWVSAQARAEVTALLARVLKPGGVAMVSYNCHPGWDALLPLRRTMSVAAGQGGSADRVARALTAARALRDAGSDYFRDTPAAGVALDRLGNEEPAYLAHEYLNEDWTLFHPGEVAAALAPVVLSYAGQARLIDGIDRFWLTGTQAALVAAANDPEETRDLILGRRFRRDLFVRDTTPVTAAEQAAWFAARRFALVRARTDCDMTTTMRAGDFDLTNPLHEALLDALAGEAATGAALATMAGARAGAVAEALTDLAALGHVQPASGAADEAVRRVSTARFNAAALNGVRMGDPAPALASPVTGSGLAVPPVDQILLDAFRFGVPLDADDPAVGVFLRETLPVLERLGIA